MADKLGFRESMTETEIVATFKKNKEEKDYWESLDVETKKSLIKEYKNNKREFMTIFKQKCKKQTQLIKMKH